MVSQIAIAAIGGYQRWVSPRKGFNCAHRVLHGGTGCAGYTKEAIRQHGLWGARSHIRGRFADCKLAAEALAMTESPPKGPWDNGKPSKRRNKWANSCDCAGGCGWPGAGKSGGCDTTPDCTPDCSCG